MRSTEAAGSKCRPSQVSSPLYITLIPFSLQGTQRASPTAGQLHCAWMAIINSSQRAKTSPTHNLETQVLSIQYPHNPPPQTPNYEFQTSLQPWTTAHHLRTSCSGRWELQSSETGSYFPSFAPPWLWGTNFLNQPPPSAPQGQLAH